MIDNAINEDWVGPSGRRGREPFTAPSKTRYAIPHGTKCEVKKLGQTNWREWRTKRFLEFRRPERESEENFTFRKGAWLLSISRGLVKVREERSQ